MSTILGDRHQLGASCNYSHPTPKTKLTLVTAGKLFLQKLASCILLLSIGIGAGMLTGLSSTALALPSGQTLVQAWDSLASADSTLLAQADIEANFVTAAVEKAESAVVQVNVSRAVGGDVPDFLKPFLGGSQTNSPSAPVLRGLGSGFVIDTTGRILTNAHVVDEADTVTVSFQDGRILEGKVLGKDPVTDVAVIEVQAEDLPKVVLGDSDKVRQGQWAMGDKPPLALAPLVIR